MLLVGCVIKTKIIRRLAFADFKQSDQRLGYQPARAVRPIIQSLMGSTSISNRSYEIFRWHIAVCRLNLAYMACSRAANLTAPNSRNDCPLAPGTYIYQYCSLVASGIGTDTCRTLERAVTAKRPVILKL